MTSGPPGKMTSGPPEKKRCMEGKYYLSDVRSDVTLIVEGQRLPGHKFVLADKSSYFDSLFYGQLVEAQTGEVVLQNTPVAPFRLVLKYMYTEEVDLTDSDYVEVIGVLRLADLYSVLPLIPICENILKNLVSVKNVGELHRQSVFLQLGKLEAICERFIAKNMTTIVSRGLITRFEREQVKMALSLKSPRAE